MFDMRSCAEIIIDGKQNAYDVIGKYILRYWEKHGIEDVVVSVATSHDGISYCRQNEIASPINCGDDIEYLNDWWEGEKHIKLYGIINVSDLDISGGVYEKE